MKFLVIVSFLALATADEDKTLDKKAQPSDNTQNISTQTQSTLLNGQVFPPTSFSNVFGANDPVSNLPYTGFNGNVSPIQTVNPDFFVAPPASNVANGAIPIFPVTRTVLPAASPVVQGIQSAFPVTGNVFPAAVNTISSQFPAVGAGILPAVTGIPNAALDAGTPAANGAISPVSGAAYRFLTPGALTGVSTQGLQTAQQVGLAAIPAFTSGILPSLSNGILQGQTIPAAIQQVLNNPAGNPSGASNIPGLNTGNIPSGPLNNVFRHS